MTDARLRELERRFAASGAPGDEAAWLRERLRTGAASRAELEVRAGLGEPGARAALGLEVAPALAEALGAAEAVLGGDPAEALGACRCCGTPPDALAGPRRDPVRRSHLKHYLGAALSSWGDLSAFKRLLPQLLELAVEAPSLARWADLRAKLARADLAAWPERERRAVAAVAEAFWRERVAGAPADRLLTRDWGELLALLGDCGRWAKAPIAPPERLLAALARRQREALAAREAELAGAAPRLRPVLRVTKRLGRLYAEAGAVPVGQALTIRWLASVRLRRLLERARGRLPGEAAAIDAALATLARVARRAEGDGRIRTAPAP